MDDLVPVSERQQAARLLSELRRRYTRQCVRCGATFEGINTARYCSKRCGHSAWQAENRRAEKEKRRLAQQKRKATIAARKAEADRIA